MPPLVASIQAAQREAEEALTKPGRQPEWAWPIQLLSAEKLAVIAMSTCLRSMAGFARDGNDLHGLCSVTGAARWVASAVRAQIEFDRWAGENPDIEQRLRRRYHKVDRRVWAKWRHKVEALRLEDWPEGQAIALGAHLIHLLVEAAPTLLAVETRSLTGGRTQRCLVPTQETHDLMADVTTRAEVARPLLMPMVIKPIPWAYAA